MRRQVNPALEGLQQGVPQPGMNHGNDFINNLMLQQQGDQRDFGTPQFLGGAGGANAHGIQTVLDAAGAGQPGGMRMRGDIGTSDSPMDGLMSAQPQVHQPSVQMGAPSKEMELRQRRARMVNQEQPAAGFYPHAGGV